MKQLVLITLSIFTLMFSSARSVRAQQAAIGFPTLEPTSQLSVDTTETETSDTTDLPTEAISEPADVPNPVVNQSGAITFNVSRNTKEKITKTPPSIERPTPKVEVNNPLPRGRLVAMSADDLFEGGSNSLVAKAVGHAEGTRTVEGGKTWAYYGHVDPGNGVWNRGSFSYQHEASSPEDADVRQLNRLRRQYEVIQQKAISSGLRLGLEEQLNGIDLANQAPLAALDRGGYIDRLREAYNQGLTGTDAVLHARTYSYINPDTNRWDAPGLGNNKYSISRDQERRLEAIAAAIDAHQQTELEPRSRISRLPSEQPNESLTAQRDSELKN